MRVTAHQLFESARSAAKADLARSSLGLAFSGFSAGLNISFSFVTAVLAYQSSTRPELAHLWSSVAYPVGFILIILARAQLFTENTLTPVLLVLDSPTTWNVLNTIRLWIVVLCANLAGAFVFSYAMSALNLPSSLEPEAAATLAWGAYEGSWSDLFARAIFGGWLIALMTWVLHAGGGLTGQIVLVWIIAALIQGANFSHSVAGATEVLYLAHEKMISYLDWFARFQVPVTLGNIVGGVVFVALVNYAQVVGAGRDIERTELQRLKEEEKVRTDRRGLSEGGGTRPERSGPGTP